VEQFLAELARHLRRDEPTRQRVVAEVGDHLRDLVAEGRARGLDEQSAELEAIDRFGSPRAFARSVRPARRRRRTIGLAAGFTAAAVAGGAFAFSEVRSTTPRAGVPRALPSAPTVTDPNGCHAAIAADRMVQALSTRIAHQTDAVDSQMLIEIGTRVKLDPATGRLVCRAAGANGRNKTIWFLATNADAPFGSSP